MMSYRVHKFVIDTHTDAGNDNNEGSKLVSGNIMATKLFSFAHAMLKG